MTSNRNDEQLNVIQFKDLSVTYFKNFLLQRQHYIFNQIKDCYLQRLFL